MCFESSNNNFENESIKVRYDQLMDAFQELYDETIKLQYKILRENIE